MKDYLIVEIIGPPGAWKTTLCEALQRDLSDLGVFSSFVTGLKVIHSSERKPPLFKSVIGYIKLLPKTLFEIAQLLPFIIKTNLLPSHLAKQRFFNVIQKTIRQAFVQQKTISRLPKRSVAIFDPGWTMRFLNGLLYIKGRVSQNIITAYINRIRPPHFLIILSVQEKTAIQRLKERPRGAPKRMRQLNPENWSTVIQNGNNTCRILSELIKSQGSNIMTFDTTHADIDTMSKKISHQIVSSF